MALVLNKLFILCCLEQPGELSLTPEKKRLGESGAYFVICIIILCSIISALKIRKIDYAGMTSKSAICCFKAGNALCLSKDNANRSNVIISHLEATTSRFRCPRRTLLTAFCSQSSNLS